MTKDEALLMAIEALETAEVQSEYDGLSDMIFKAINACKEALEQPTQDYVLICKKCGDELGLEYVPDEQPAQEPVEVYGILDDGDYVSVEATKEGAIKHCEFMNKHDCNCTYKPLYTHPKEWQGLSGEEFVAIAKSIWGDNLGMGDGYGSSVAWASSYATIEPSSKMLLLLQAIDKALREKNT